MALVKVTYVDEETVIGAENLNDIQDAIIENEESIAEIESGKVNKSAQATKTTAMTQPVGIDSNGKLWTAPGGNVTSVNGKTGAVALDAEDVGALPDDTPLFSGSYNDLSNKPTIPTTLAALAADSTHRTVTDTEKSTWNGKGTYSKPSGGIPKTDLASAVQTSLGLADTALQQHQSLAAYAKTADLAAVATSGSYNDLTDKPAGGSLEVREELITGMGINPDGNTFRDVTLTYGKTPIGVVGYYTSNHSVHVYMAYVNSANKTLTIGAHNDTTVYQPSITVHAFILYQ